MTKSSTRTANKPSSRSAPIKPGKRPTKADTILKLLKSRQGASIEEMQKATGWQAHSVRGFISGTVKKRMGLAVGTEQDKVGIRRYRIAESANIPAGQ